MHENSIFLSVVQGIHGFNEARAEAPFLDKGGKFGVFFIGLRPDAGDPSLVLIGLQHDDGQYWNR